MTYEIIIRNGTIVPPYEDPYCGDIGINDGSIAAIAKPKTLTGGQTIDATDKYILPGVIDAHTHHGEYNTYEEDARTESQSALVGGVTTIGNMLIGLERSWQEVVPEYLEEVRGNYYHDHFLTLELTSSNSPKENIEFAIDNGVTSFKWFPTRKFEDSGNIRDGLVDEYVSILSNYDIPTTLGYHSENIEITQKLTDQLMATDRGGFDVIVDRFPGRAESQSLVSACSLVEHHDYDDNLYAVHISAKQTAESLSKLHNAGYDVTGETCPHHLALTAADCDDRMKISPPPRDSSHQDELWEHIADGTIDCIGADHAANSTGEKIGETIWESLYGFPSTPLILPIVLSEGVNEGRISLTRAAEIMCGNPAQEWGLYPAKGDILIGSDADLVVVDLEETKTVTLDTIKAANDYSPYEGQSFTGWPTHTIVNGTIAYSDGEIITEPQGGYIHRPLSS